MHALRVCKLPGTFPRLLFSVFYSYLCAYVQIKFLRLMTRDVPNSCVSSSWYPWSSVYWYILGAQTIPVGIINRSSALGGLRLCTIHSHLRSPCLAWGAQEALGTYVTRKMCWRKASDGFSARNSVRCLIQSQPGGRTGNLDLHIPHNKEKTAVYHRAWETQPVTVLHSRSSILNGVIHSFLVMPCSLPDLNSPVGGWTHTPCCGRQSPRHWAARESPCI